MPQAGWEPWPGTNLHSYYSHFTTGIYTIILRTVYEERIIEISRESISHVLLVCHGFISTSSISHYWTPVILKSYQFTVRIKCERVPFSLLLIQDQLTRHFHWFYTSLRDHYNQSGNQTYSTMERLDFSLRGGILRTRALWSPSANINFLQHPSTSSSWQISGLNFYSNTQ